MRVCACAASCARATRPFTLPPTHTLGVRPPTQWDQGRVYYSDQKFAAAEDGGDDAALSPAGARVKFREFIRRFVDEKGVSVYRCVRFTRAPARPPPSRMSLISARVRAAGAQTAAIAALRDGGAVPGGGSAASGPVRRRAEQRA